MADPEIRRWVYRRCETATPAGIMVPKCERCNQPIFRPADAVMLGQYVGDGAAEVSPIHEDCIQDTDQDLGDAEFDQMGEFQLYLVPLAH